jgi:hypothetical protein
MRFLESNNPPLNIYTMGFAGYKKTEEKIKKWIGAIQ